MIIKSFTGESEQDALILAKKELGDNFTILKMRHSGRGNGSAHVRDRAIVTVVASERNVPARNGAPTGKVEPKKPAIAPARPAFAIRSRAAVATPPQATPQKKTQPVGLGSQVPPLAVRSAARRKESLTELFFLRRQMRNLKTRLRTRDSLTSELESLKAAQEESRAKVDGLTLELNDRDATIRSLREKLQTQGIELEAIRKTDLNSRAMARTFGTMSMEELAPIMARLDDNIVVSIYRQTPNKRRKNLLAALGEKRAAALTNELLTPTGDRT